MIPANATRARLTPLSPSEAERCRIDRVTCAWVGCPRIAAYVAGYAYVTRAGHEVSTERHFCDHHGRVFARRFRLPLTTAASPPARRPTPPR